MEPTMRAETNERERGSVLVELAIVLPLVLALVFGIISFGTAHEQKVSLTNAAREGARFGATLPWSATWATQVQAVTVASATGDLNASVSGRAICVALNDGTGWNTGSPCFNDGLATNEPRVQVKVARTANLDAFFVRGGTTITGQAVVRYEVNP
jgi:Flp pilus assembly protein TadG